MVSQCDMCCFGSEPNHHLLLDFYYLSLSGNGLQRSSILMFFSKPSLSIWRICWSSWPNQFKLVTLFAVICMVKFFFFFISAWLLNLEILCDYLHTHIVPNNKGCNPPKINWIRCINDGVTRGFIGPSTSGGIFKNHYTNLWNCFDLNTSNVTSFIVDLIDVTEVVKSTFKNWWNSMWLKNGSQLITLTANLIIIFLGSLEKEGLIA